MQRINLKKANVARSDTIRDINRRIVLNYIRERAGISRAEIALETKLQRSTISLIVEELKTHGLIDESEGESTGGRPPILLKLRSHKPVAIGVDVSITHTIVGTCDLAGRVLEKVEFATDSNSDITLQRIIEGVRHFSERAERPEGIGISLPGLVDPETRSALFIPHFKWRDWLVAEQVEAAVGLPVIVDNDANAIALAELWLGRTETREVRDFIAVLVEDGIGTGIVFDGLVYHGRAGAAGEFGHMYIGKNGPITCSAGSNECWEAFASQRATLARYGKLHPQANGEVSFAQLVENALKGDKIAIKVLLKTAKYLGRGISNIIKGLSPEVVIICGEIARAWPLIAQEIRANVEADSICRDLEVPRIIASSLGATPRLRGALSLVLASKFTSTITSKVS